MFVDAAAEVSISDDSLISNDRHDFELVKCHLSLNSDRLVPSRDWYAGIASVDQIVLVLILGIIGA